MFDAMKVAYFVNGQAQNIWRRVLATKTGATAVTIACVAAERALQGQLAPALAVKTVATAVATLVVKDLFARAELAANAANPDLSHVTAETNKPLDISK